MGHRQFAATLLSSFTFAVAASGQMVGPPPNCTPAPPQGCDEQTRLSRSYDVVLELATEEVVRTVAHGPTVWNTACNCAVLPCWQPPRVCDPVQYTHTRTEQTCWEVSGSVEVEGKTSLLLSLFGELGVTVNIGGSLSRCIEVSTSIAGTVPTDDCWNHAGRDVWQLAEVTGTIRTADVVDEWECLLPNGILAPVTTMCGVRQANGRADNVEMRVWDRSDWPLCMGGPAQTDFVYSTQCCTPIAPCQEDNGFPCCQTQGCP